MKSWSIAVLLACLVVCTGRASVAQENLVLNGRFERPAANGAPEGWDPFWSRETGVGSSAVDGAEPHSGSPSIRVEHGGQLDWSVGQTRRLPVTTGDIFVISGRVKADRGQAELGVITRDTTGEALSWSYGRIEVGGKHDWTAYRRRFVIPRNCSSIQFRIIGVGPGSLRLADPQLVREGSVSEIRRSIDRTTLRLQNRFLDVSISPESGALTVTDRRNGNTYRQESSAVDLLPLKSERPTNSVLTLTLRYLPTDAVLTARYELVSDRPEIKIQLSGETSISDCIAFPHPFASSPGERLVLPLNEGVLYPVDDESVPAMRLVTYSGHGICMPWYGVAGRCRSGVDDTPGWMAIINTPDDAAIEVGRTPAKVLSVQPTWEPSRGNLRYSRRIQFIFNTHGGYVGMAKRYCAYAQQTGLFKTLAQKRRENPNVDLLVGAVNVWNWDMDKVALCREMKAAGMDHVLWSNEARPDEIAAINKLGYLTSRYDIFQDVWPKDSPAYLRHDGWPEDLVWLPDGTWMHGWADIQHHPDGTQTVYQGGVISSGRGLARAKVQIPEDLKTHPYRCRFIDTTTASPFREDYNPAHPLTRSDDRKYKMALLDFCSKDEKLVVGTETGIDPSVPYVHYYEGMMSLGPFRLPDAGYDMLGYRKPTPEFLKFMVGSYYRIPLWELVYHECVVAGWYWGDGSNKAPEVWDRRDLFNILYGTPPLFMMNKEMWSTQKDRFVRSYRDVCPIVRQFGYDELVTHTFLTADHNVQAARWRSGKQVFVNFGDTPYTLPTGGTLPPMHWQIH